MTQVRPVMRVVKVGGSLLWGERLGARLHQWLSAQVPGATIVVVGGGRLADAVRTLDRRFRLTAQAAHEQGVRAMQVNAFVLCQLCPALSWLERLLPWASDSRHNGPSAGERRVVLDPLPFILHDEPQLAGPRLPWGWEVTSDSIAARISQVVDARELVLLKSTLPSTASNQLSLINAAEAGYVDSHFPVAAEGLAHIRAINFREQGHPEVRLGP